MTTIEIKTEALRRALAERGRRLGDYAAHLVEMGHRIGTLSGAELRGRAKDFAGHYGARRDAVIAAVMAVTGGVVTAGTPAGSARRVKVWVAGDQPVRLRLV